MLRGKFSFFNATDLWRCIGLSKFWTEWNMTLYPNCFLPKIKITLHKEVLFSPGEKLLFCSKAQYFERPNGCYETLKHPFEEAGSRRIKTVCFGTKLPSGCFPAWPFPIPGNCYAYKPQFPHLFSDYNKVT